MATTLYDTFTESSNTALTSHTPEIGGTWTQHAAATVAATVYATPDSVATDGSTNYAWYYNDVDPGADNYTVTATLVVVTVTTSVIVGVTARMDTSANTWYDTYYDKATDSWLLRKLVAGSPTTIDSIAASSTTAGTPTTSQVMVLTLTVGTNSQTVTLDGETILSGTDSSITARGKAGFISRRGGPSAGTHITDFKVTNANVTATFTGSIKTDGKTMTCVFVKASGSWSSPSFGSVRGAITVGSDTIYTDDISGSIALSTTSTSNDTATFDVTLGGWVESGDTATISFAAGFMTDVGGSVVTDEETDTSLTNNSTKTLSASALTRQVAHPVFNWAVATAYPWDGAEAIVAVKGGDHFSGIAKVVFTFFESDGTTPYSVDVGTASGSYSTANSIDVSARVYEDIYNRGVYETYHLCYIDTSSLPSWSSATNDIVVKAVVHGHDGTTTNLAENHLLRTWPASPTVIYVAGTTGNDGTGDGSSGNPYKTIDAAYADITDATDGVEIMEAGTYTWTPSNKWGSATRTKYLRLYPSSGLTKPDWTAAFGDAAGAGDVIMDAATSGFSLQLDDWALLEDLTFDGGGVPSTTAATKTITTEDTLNGNSYRFLLNICNDYGSVFHGTGPTYDTSPMPLNGDHTYLYAYRQVKGFRGPIISESDYGFLIGFKADSTGTGSHVGDYQTVAQMYARNLFTDSDFGTYYPTAHSDTLHANPTNPLPLVNTVLANIYEENGFCALGFLCEYGLTGVLMENMALWRKLDNYALQFGLAEIDNLQIVNCTLIRPGGGDTENASWGTDSSDGVGTPKNVCMVNNVTNNLFGFSGSVGSYRVSGNQVDNGYSFAGFIDADVTDYTPDLRPTTSSVLTGAGVDVDLDKDINGVAMSSPPDVGAMQLAAAPTVSDVSPTSIAKGATADITLTGTGFIDGISAASNYAAEFTVNTTTFNSSTEVVVNVTGGSGTAGAYLDALTLTNPDGQTVDVALTLTAAGGFDLSWSPVRNGSLGVMPLRGYPL